MTDGSAIQDRQSPPSAASLDIIFHPRNVAVVGASAAAAGSTYSLGFGTGYISSLKARGFQGPIYPVNPKYREVLGLPCYPSLLAIPGPVDHVVVCIPVARVLELIDDCVRKGVRSVQFFTAGFAEAGEDGAALERELVARARRGGVRVLLNCVGIYCPRSGLCLNPDISPLLPLEPGPVAIISQSGGNTHYLAGWGALRGLQYSKVISYGNAADVDESELLEYLAWDPETEIIGAYIEGVRDGRRFARALRQAAARKPVVV
ncbi:MAG TPA: CoA-binding protein, partial [Dehalococcoidia bacterium]|nr:CoA-binding protein [Dehalococcoidia bacterium]